MNINAEREAAASPVTPGKSSFHSNLALRGRYRVARTSGFVAIMRAGPFGFSSPMNR